MVNKRTICSFRQANKYYWRFCASGDHIDETVSELSKLLDSPSLRVSPIQHADALAGFRSLLKLATEGKLIPGDHVKTVQLDPTLDLFEIRWNNIRISRIDRVSGLYSKGVLRARLYYVEEGEPWFVGLHCHEKKVDEADPAKTTKMQDEEIQKAIRLAREGKSNWWGVSELGAEKV